MGFIMLLDSPTGIFGMSPKFEHAKETYQLQETKLSGENALNPMRNELQKQRSKCIIPFTFVVNTLSHLGYHSFL